MKGSLSLFADIFVKDPAPQPRLRKGRSHHHLTRRNECLTDRYYYHAKYTGQRYDIILQTLSDEFFLSEVTIPDIISANYARLKELHREQPAKSVFVKKWPHLVW